ncbi:MAG: zinc-binding dehydrogenase [Chloroflexota bacterium]
MSNTMKIVQIAGPDNAQWVDTPIPTLEADEVLVKVAAITTCPHWDLHILGGVSMYPGGTIDYPYIPGQPGHEMTGEVAAVGSGVDDFAVGDHVVAWRDPGQVRQGCYAQYVPFQAKNLLKIPTDLPPAAISSLELAMCVQVAFDQFATITFETSTDEQGEGVSGRRFAVSGLGPAGLIAVQMARSYGAREIIAIDPLPERRAMAMELGATKAIAPTEEEFPAGVTSEHTVDMAIDCTGLKVSIEFLLARTRQNVLIFGLLREDVSFGFAQWRSGVSLMGYGFHNRAAAERALQLVLDGKVNLEPLATHELPLSRYADGVALLRTKEAIKVRFLPWA